MKLDKYIALGKTKILDDYSHVLDRLFSGIFIGVILFIFLNIWKTVYAGAEQVGGFTLTHMIWYLSFAEMISFASGTNRIEKLGAEIRNGSLSASLLKPWSFIAKELTILSANFVSILLTAGVIGFAVAFFLVGPLDISLATLPFVCIVLLGGVLLSFMIVTSFALLSLWLEDVSALYWIYQKILFIAGGMLIPLEFYPSWMQDIIQYFPTTFLMYWPSKLFVHFSFEKFFYVLASQSVWIVIMSFIMIMVYKKGIRKVGIYGG